MRIVNIDYWNTRRSLPRVETKLTCMHLCETPVRVLAYDYIVYKAAEADDDALSMIHRVNWIAKRFGLSGDRVNADVARARMEIS